MKKLLFLFLLIAAASCSDKGGYNITGVVTGDVESYQNVAVVLSNSHRGEPIYDTVLINNGKFQFTGEVVTPEYYYITIEGAQGRIRLFLENAKYSYNIDPTDLANAKLVGGGPTQKILNDVDQERQRIMTEYNIESLQEESRQATTTEERKREISNIFSDVNKQLTAFTKKLNEENPDSFFALMNLRSDMSGLTLEELKERFTVFENNIALENNRNVKEIKERLENLAKIQVGMMVQDFSQPDPDGNMIALSSIYPKNKVTMVDFWAGWCGPCRRFNPTLVGIYKQYKSKGFEILGVSLDRDRETWINAIKDDKLPWKQVSELKYWDTPPVKTYCIGWIPNNLFIDSEGKILARQISEEEIVELLKKHLD